MKFKNIEDVWAYAKNKLVNAQISSIQKTGSSKFFDLTIPKSMIKKFPEGSRNRDLEYTITETAGEIECFLENTSDVTTIVDTRDFFDAISVWCGINESSEQMNQNAIIGIESTSETGYDKVITFSYYTSRAELEKQFKKLGKPYMLNVYPGDEAEVFVKNSDVDKFKGLITALTEKIDTTMNMIMMEGITIKGRPVPEKLKSDFSSQEISFINSVIGNTWYQVTPKSKVFKDVNDLSGKSRKDSEKFIDGVNYTIYEAPKGTKFLLMDMGMGSEAFLFGSPKINESEEGDKYREFFENKLKQWNVSSPAELTQQDRSKFFTEIRDEWKKQKDNVSESFVIKGRALPDKFKSDFDASEKKYIDDAIGTTWYQVTPRSKVYGDATALMKKSKKIESKRLGWFTYDLYQAPKGTKFLYSYDGYGADAFMFGETKINESYEENGYTILDQAEFRAEFGGDNNLASYALYSLYNTRLVVKCTPENPKYYKIKAKVESMPEITEMDKGDIHVYRQTASNLIIIYNDNIYWAYNTGTNLQLLNEAELVKGIGRVFDTLSDRGEMSNNAVVAAIKALSDTMSSLSVNPTTNSIKAYKVAEDEYQCLIGELEKRGLRPSNR